LDSKTGHLRITDAEYGNLQPLNFVIGGNTLELTPNAQIWPRALNSAIGGNENSTYLNVQDIGNTDPGIDFILGMAFLDWFYAVFDTGNHQVGLARTSFTNSTINQ
jgi:cathepsin E